MSEIKVTPWNPFTGCRKISPACDNCYAEPLAMKLQHWGTKGYENGFKFTIHDDRIAQAPPLSRKKPTLYFINNMSDSFHEHASDEVLEEILEVVKQAHWHNFYMLTKRSKRMRVFFETRAVPDNLWLGVTVENKKHGLPRIRDLQAIKAANKHLCCEPLLEELGNIDLEGIRFVVGGGESAMKARRAELNWVLSLKEQCDKQQVHFYWKSWGTFDGEGIRKGNRQSGNLINGVEYKSIPENLMPNKNTHSQQSSQLSLFD
ncbi:DUF5131 family protein [Vibrio sp. D404a]|uniref:DUF5131 family protein n=1 Tax=unclassified Vibrio TaxID=2614977 RepID=UPI002552481A|nr:MULTISPECIES: DUF5131 family protein [unclassified Vibrio]MDK9735998.1 DUF5131 family protein [Vibrio sp. D404a]MDK9797836.1 DUF5131 family protein [Vibrio sp. D449a]